MLECFRSIAKSGAIGGNSIRANHWALLVCLALGLESVYAVGFLRPLPLLDYYAIPLLDLGKITGYGRSEGLQFLGVVFLLFSLYFVSFRLIRSVGDRLEPLRVGPNYLLVFIVLNAIVFNATLALVYPYGAADIFDYVFHGRIIAHFRANPFLQPAAEFIGDPFLPYVAWQDLPFTYGPLWAVLGAGLAAIAKSDLLANLLLFKGAAILAYFASLPLIYSILNKVAPKYRASGLLLYAWNPLLLTETAGNGHNDTVMMAFVLASIRLAFAERLRHRVLAPIVMMASVLVKFVTAMLFPVLLFWLWLSPLGRARRALAFGTALAGVSALTVAVYWPFWAGPATFAVLRRDALYTASVPAVVKFALEQYFGLADASFVGSIAFALFAAYALVEASHLDVSKFSAIRGLYRTTLCYLLFAVLWFQPWYLIWLITIAAVFPRLDVAHLTVLFSGSAMMNYFIFGYWWIWNSSDVDLLGIQVVAVIAIYALPLVYFAYSHLLRPPARAAFDS